MERIKLNLIPSGVAPIVHLSQYDDGRQFGIDLFEGESVYVLDGTETLTVNSRKPDGHVVTLTVTNTGTSSLDVDTVEQLTAVHGVSYAKLKIEKGSVTIATLPFLIDVSRDPLENGDPSESFVDNLQTQIASAVADQYDADSVVFDANPTAGHGVGFAVTSEGVLNAIPDELDDLSDVTATTPASGEALVWDGAKWTNGTPSLDVGDLDDVAITTPTNGEILVYNNGSWENQANPASTTNFAPDYDDTVTYNTNDKVIYQGLMYVCLEDSVTGAWDSTKWQNISVADYTAELLPIESGSATNTKSYIDNQIAVSDITSSLTLDTNYFVASTKQVYKSGNIVNICLRGSLTATNGAILGTIATYYPKASRIICDFHNNGAPTPITTGAVWLNGENGRMYYFGGSVSSLDVCITVTYICNNSV